MLRKVSIRSRPHRLMTAGEVAKQQEIFSALLQAKLFSKWCTIDQKLHRVREAFKKKVKIFELFSGTVKKYLSIFF